MNTFFIIKQLFIHSQIDEKALSGDSLFFYVSVILFLKKERFTSDVSCNCIWFYCFYEDSGDQAVSARDILVMEGNPGDPADISVLLVYLEHYNVKNHS